MTGGMQEKAPKGSLAHLSTLEKSRRKAKRAKERLERGLLRPMQKRPCSAQGCDEPGWCKEMCKHHYSAWLRLNNPKKCQVLRCGKPVVAHGMCGNHWRRKRNGTDINRPVHYRGQPLEDRFWGGIEYDLNGGCWLWSKSGNPGGYGTIPGPQKKNILAHRASWTLFRGEIPQGLHVLHKCDVRRCTNPDHLWLGTHQENMDDREAKSRGNHMPPTITFQGRTLSQESWAKIIGISASQISRRLKKMSVEEALTRPVPPRYRRARA